MTSARLSRGRPRQRSNEASSRRQEGAGHRRRPRYRTRRRNRACTVATQFFDTPCTYQPARERARDSLDVRGERRVQRSVECRVVADDINHRNLRPACVVQVGERVRKAWPQMEQSAGGLSCHPRVAVGRACGDALKQTRHRAHAGLAIQRFDEMNLARTRIHEAKIDAGCCQARKQALGPVHGNTLLCPPIFSGDSILHAR